MHVSIDLHIQALITETKYNFVHLYKVRPWMNPKSFNMLLTETVLPPIFGYGMPNKYNFSWWGPERMYGSWTKYADRGTSPPPPCGIDVDRDRQPLWTRASPRIGGPVAPKRNYNLLFVKLIIMIGHIEDNGQLDIAVAVSSDTSVTSIWSMYS